MKPRFRSVGALSALSVALLQVGCATPTTAPSAAAVAPAESAMPQRPVTAQVAPEAANAAPDSAASAAESDGQPLIIRGTDRVTRQPQASPRVTGPVSTFKFEDAPVADVVRVMFGDILKTDYVVHQPISGSITLSTRQKIPADQALLLLETALQANGILMARDARGVYHVGRAEALRGIVPVLRQAGNGPLQPGYGAIVVPLQYIGAAEMAAILRPMVPPEAIVRVDNARNLLVLTGTRGQAEGWLDIVNTFDVNALQGMSVGVFPLKHASVREVEAAFNLISSGTVPAARPGGAANAGAAPGAAGSPNAPGGATPTPMAENLPFFGAVRLLPIERINSILVVTSRAAYLDEVRYWIEQLDRPNANSQEPQLHVYAVQNGSARHLAQVLQGIYGGGPAAGSGVTGVAPGLQGANVGGAFGGGFGSVSSLGGGGFGAAGALGGGLGGGFGSGSAMGTGAGMGGGLGQFNRPGATQQPNQAGAGAANLGGGVRVMADEINNSVLVYSTPAEYARILASLKRLDVSQAQVLIEATIVEVTLKDDLDYGLQWAFSDSSRGGLSGSGLLGSPTTTTPLGALGGVGFSYSLANSLGNVRAVLRALSEKTQVKVISSPSLMVLDNHPASIMVGNQEPIKTGDTYITGVGVSSNIQYKDTGVMLTVQPSVNAGNMVSMQIGQNVTELDAARSTAGGQPAFMQRQIQSKVAVRSGETLVLGGLIKEQTSGGKAGVPVLSSIPLIGALFGRHQESGNRTELLVVLTPRVVRSDQEARDISRELRDRMKGLTTDAFLRGAQQRSMDLVPNSTQPLPQGVFRQ